MTGQNHRVGPAQIPDQRSDLNDLRRVQANRRLVQNDHARAAQKRSRNAYPLTVSFGQIADQAAVHLGQAGAPFGGVHSGCAVGAVFYPL